MDNADKESGPGARQQLRINTFITSSKPPPGSLGPTRAGQRLVFFPGHMGRTLVKSERSIEARLKYRMEANIQSPEPTKTSSAVLTTPMPAKIDSSGFLLRLISEIVPRMGESTATMKSDRLNPVLQ
jgi:hypothetical protein